MRVDRIAMIVGIDDYKKQNCSLNGCVNDAHSVSNILLCHFDGALNFDCTNTFTSNDYVIDSQFLLKEAEAFFKLEAQVALFYFSGHGFLNNLGGYLVTQDAKAYREGVKMDDILILANEARENRRIQEIIIVLDCCHSGFFGDSPIFKDTTIIREGISILAASRKYESAIETNGQGRFTRLFVNALAGGASDFCGEVKVPAIYAYVDDALGPIEQRPIFKSNVSKLISLRNTEIDFDSSILKHLLVYFKSPFEELQLTPSLVKSKSKDAFKKGDKIFHLLLLHDRQLIRTSNLMDIESAAKHNEKCILTELGRYYWNIVREREKSRKEI